MTGMRLLGLIALLAACGGDAPPMRTKTFGGDRPVDLQTPATLTEGKQYPLLVVLHGFGANGFVQSAYFHTSDLVTQDMAFVVAPDGTPNSAGRLFWNADPYCCDFENINPDDVGYIGGLIDDISAEWPVDKDAVFVLGHSNGGYMAYRMACDRADVIAAIGSLAGDAASTTCTPTQHVAVAHLHGTADTTVPYAGAGPSVMKWAGYNGCGTERTVTNTIDLDDAISGAETQQEVTMGCPADGDVELWTMNGSTHIPSLNAGFAVTMMNWFLAHKR